MWQVVQGQGRGSQKMEARHSLHRSAGNVEESAGVGRGTQDEAGCGG